MAEEVQKLKEGVPYSIEIIDPVSVSKKQEANDEWAQE